MAEQTGLSPYHCRYLAMRLSRRDGGAERYLPALFSARIDLHPHQVEAALFAGRSPHRDGVILADEEGLGKTIEAGIALLQASLEGRRRLLVLCPPALKEHWQEELAGKFGLDATGPEDAGRENAVVAMGYPEALRQVSVVAGIAWDLCVLDEAHTLAGENISTDGPAAGLHTALQGRPMPLLTATPMQNSVMDLYHLVRLVDEHAFGGGPELFREKYTGAKANRSELAMRAQMICQRTLRHHALTMPVTRRIVRTLMVRPSPEETALSKAMSAYFHRERLAAFPTVKEHEIRLTYWKLLASSTRALAESLTKVAQRLDVLPAEQVGVPPHELSEERYLLHALVRQGEAIARPARASAFLDALREAFHRLAVDGARRKAAVFSGSRVTLAFLHDLLSETAFAGRVVTHPGGAGGKRALEAFRDGRADILLATDGAGTGLDLSHCALVVNYDLPWNVQKLEQRISRCHRYGQQHDVLVLNFIDPANRADRRLNDSINAKLKKFDDVFGASESVLGAVIGDDAPALPDEATTDMPRPAAQIRIDRTLFEKRHRDAVTRQVERAEDDLLAHFDDAVRQRFRRYGEEIPKALSAMEEALWVVTRQRLDGKALFHDQERRFVLDRPPYPGLRLSRFVFGMDKDLPVAERYRLNHPLARRVLADCLEGELARGALTLRASGAWRAGMAGELGLWRFYYQAKTTSTLSLMLCGRLTAGPEGPRTLTVEECAEVMRLRTVAWEGGPMYREARDIAARPQTPGDALEALREQAFTAWRTETLAARDEALNAELTKLRRWAEEEEDALVLRQEAMKKLIEALATPASGEEGFTGRLRRNKERAELEKERRLEEERIFLLSAEIQRKRDALMDAARSRSEGEFNHDLLFVVGFRVVE